MWLSTSTRQKNTEFNGGWTEGYCLTCIPGHVAAQFNRHGNCATAAVDTIVISKFQAACFSKITVELTTFLPCGLMSETEWRVLQCFTASDVQCSHSIPWKWVWPAAFFNKASQNPGKEIIKVPESSFIDNHCSITLYHCILYELITQLAKMFSSLQRMITCWMKRLV